MYLLTVIKENQMGERKFQSGTLKDTSQKFRIKQQWKSTGSRSSTFWLT